MDAMQQYSRDVLERLDFTAEYEKLGVQFTGKPRGNGWQECRASGRDDTKPSAAVCVESSNGSLGQYKDSATGKEKKIGFFDFAVQVDRFKDWKEARDFYAKQVGVERPKSKKERATKASGKDGGGLAQNMLTVLNEKLRPLNLLKWTKAKQGIGCEAIDAARGRLVDWAGKRTCFAFPAFLPAGNAPVAAVLYDAAGKPFSDIGRDVRLLRGSTLGLVLIGSREQLAAAETIVVCEGVTDALAVAAHLPAGYFAVSGSHGCGEFSHEVAEFARGKRVIVIYDADNAGEAGGKNAAACCIGIATEVRIGRLPFPLAENHGQDLRDFVNEGRDVAELLRQIEAQPAETAENLPTPKEGKKKKDSEPGVIAELADAICEHDHFAQDAGGKVYRYSLGRYITSGDEFIRQRVKALLSAWDQLGEWLPRLAESVVEFIRVDAPHLWPRPPGDRINVKNGILRIVDRTLLPHSPDHLSTVQLPVEFDPNAICPKIEMFASQVFPDDAISLAWEVPAFCMTPDRVNQKSVLLIGKGGNGKSTWLNLLRRFLGNENCAATSLHALESQRFATAALVEKLACIAADLPTSHLEGTSVFKSVTGGDSIPIEYKYQGTFQYEPFCKLIFSANEPPVARDRSEGYFDRWLVIPFNRKFRGVDGERGMEELLSEIAPADEMSGMLNMALDALAGMKNRRGRFSESPSLKEGMERLLCASNPVASFLKECTEEAEGILTPKATLLRLLNDWLATKDKPPVKSQKLGLELKKLRPDVHSTKCACNGQSRVSCFRGIKMRECPNDKHDWIEHHEKDGMIRTECAKCGKWPGSRPAKQSDKTEEQKEF